jgi:hypothetical protein
MNSNSNFNSNFNSPADSVANELDLIGFVCEFFKAHGAELEQNSDIIDVLLPQKLVKALDVDEYICVAPATYKISDTNKLKNLHKIEFGTSLLDNIVSMAGSHFPVLDINLKYHYLKTQGFNHLIKSQFEFYKCKPRVTDTAEMINRYILLTCCFTAQSDEQKQGLIDFTFNIDTGSLIPGMMRMLPGIEKEYKTQSVNDYSSKDADKIYNLINLYGHDIVSKRLENFIKSMNRRHQRDSKSLDTYYNALKKEMVQNLERLGISSRVVKERKEKIDLLPDELEAKKKDLFNKYSININFIPVAAIKVHSPCVKIFITLVAGRKKHEISMIYNPAIKQVEPVVCQACKLSTYSFGVSSNMHINCLNCL